MNGIAPSKPGSLIAMGASCFVSYADETSVSKGYQIWAEGKRISYYDRDCEDALSREAAVYKHLGEHPNILRFFGLEEVSLEVHSLRLELAPLGNIRQYIKQHSTVPLPISTRLRMCLDIAAGLAYLHSQHVQHCDLSCRNFLIFPEYRVKICDFGGSLVEGYNFRPSVCEESHYELPRRGRLFNDRPPMKRELFALGSAVYEIMAWKKPFGDLEGEEAEARYAREEFPRLRGIEPSEMILNCWMEKYNSADQVVEALQQEILRQETINDTK